MTSAARNCPKCHREILVFATAERRNVACPSCGTALQLDGDCLTLAKTAKPRRRARARPQDSVAKQRDEPTETLATAADPATGLVALAVVALLTLVFGGVGAALFLNRRPSPTIRDVHADVSAEVRHRPTARDMAPAKVQPRPEAEPVIASTASRPPTETKESMPTVPGPREPSVASLPAVVDKVRHSVATIIVDADWMGTRGGFGSGFIVDRSNWLATNLHVVAGARHLKAVRKRDNRDEWIDIDVTGFVACDAGKDLVVLILAEDWPSAPLDLAARRPQLGEDVFAVGTPKGLSETVTRGIVSQFRSADDLDNEDLEPETAIIQTDAFMTHGNSGGPLCSARGEVVGVNSFVRTNESDSVEFHFAVAAEELAHLLARAHEPRPLRDLPREGN